uniref:hypothetical protein n=1 Tax=Borreliella tanukii TaxID=56146 RepID=UPI003B21FE09
MSYNNIFTIKGALSNLKLSAVEHCILSDIKRYSKYCFILPRIGIMNCFSLNFLLLLILFGCDFHHIKDTNKFSVGMEYLVDDFEYVNKTRLEIEEKELLEIEIKKGLKEKELLERKRREQLENEAKDRYSSEEFRGQARYCIREYQDKIERLEKEIEEETLKLNFYIENGYKRGWTSNVYQFHLDEIKRLTNEKKENNSTSYLQLKDNSIKYHKTYTDEIESRIPNVKSRLIERNKANIERYKNEIEILHRVEKKDLINKTEISKFRAEFDKLSYDNMLKENKNSVEIWKENIEDCQYRIISYEVEYSEYNKLKSKVSTDSLKTINLRLQNIKNLIEEEKLTIKGLENKIKEIELRSKELAEKLQKL